MSHLANKFGDLPVCRGQKNSLKSSQFEITIVKSKTMDVCVSLYVLDMALFWEIHLVLEIVTICDLFVYLGGHKLFTAEKRNKSQLKQDSNNEDKRKRRYEGGWVWRSGIAHQKQLILHSRWRRVQAGWGTGRFTNDKKTSHRVEDAQIFLRVTRVDTIHT